jgi:hypothetical protein
LCRIEIVDKNFLCYLEELVQESYQHDNCKDLPVKKELAMSPHGLRLTVPLLDDGLQAIARALSDAPIFWGKKIKADRMKCTAIELLKQSKFNVKPMKKVIAFVR